MSRVQPEQCGHGQVGRSNERGLEQMGNRETVTSGPEERLQRAARILAMGAIRAARRKLAAMAGSETAGEAGTDPPAGHRQAPAGPPECE